MKNWFRLGSIVIGTLTAAALTFSAASAAPPGTADHPSPAGHAPTATLVPKTMETPFVEETLFVPIAPCRIVDTRRAGGFLVNGVARSFYVGGTIHFLDQGGKAGGCGIPSGATGVTTNVTTTAQSAVGYLTGYPTGSAEPLANFISYRANTTITANATFALSTRTVIALTLTAHGGRTDAIIDVTGYYIPQLEGVVDDQGAPITRTTRMVTAVRVERGHYQVTWDRDVSKCAVTASIFGQAGFTATLNANSVYTSVYTTNITGALTDYAFQVTVTC